MTADPTIYHIVEEREIRFLDAPDRAYVLEFHCTEDGVYWRAIVTRNSMLVRTVYSPSRYGAEIGALEGIDSDVAAYHKRQRGRSEP